MYVHTYLAVICECLLFSFVLFKVLLVYVGHTSKYTVSWHLFPSGFLLHEGMLSNSASDGFIASFQQQGSLSNSEVHPYRYSTSLYINPKAPRDLFQSIRLLYLSPRTSQERQPPPIKESN